MADSVDITQVNRTLKDIARSLERLVKVGEHTNRIMIENARTNGTIEEPISDRTNCEG